MSLGTRKETYILIPSYEPDQSLVGLVTSLKEEGFDIILVNDGSSEEFDFIFNQVKDKVIYLKQTPNKGKGAALRYGFSYANLNPNGHKYVITCDGDGQHAISDIIKVNDDLNKYNCTVLGVRKFDENTPKNSKVGNFMSRLCRTLITKEYLTDDQCGLRGFPIDMMNELISIRGDHYEYEMNMISLFQFKRYKIHETVIQTIYLDNNSASHFLPGIDGFRIQKTIWIYDLVPLLSWIFGLIAFIVFNIIIYNSSISAHPALQIIGFSEAQWFMFLTYFGLISLAYPTKNMGKRCLLEGTFYLIKGTIAFGIFSLLFFLLKMWSPVAYLISTFLVCLLNYFIALWAYKIKINKNRGIN